MPEPTWDTVDIGGGSNEPTWDSVNADQSVPTGQPSTKPRRRDEGILDKAKSLLQGGMTAVNDYAGSIKARSEASRAALLRGDVGGFLSENPGLDPYRAILKSQVIGPAKGVGLAGRSLTKGLVGTAAAILKSQSPFPQVQTPIDAAAMRARDYLNNPEYSDILESGGAIEAPGKALGQVAGSAAPYMFAAPIAGAMEMGGNAYLDTGGNLPNAALHGAIGGTMGKVGQVSGMVTNALGIPNKWALARQGLNLGGEALAFSGLGQMADEATGVEGPSYGDRLKGAITQLLAARAGGALMNRARPGAAPQPQPQEAPSSYFPELPDFGETKVGSERGMIAARTGGTADVLLGEQLRKRFAKMDPKTQAAIEDWLSEKRAAESFGRDPNTVPELSSPEAIEAFKQIKPLLKSQQEAYQRLTNKKPSEYMTPRGFTENDYTPGARGASQLYGSYGPQGREFYALENPKGERYLAFKNEDGSYKIFNPSEKGKYLNESFVPSEENGWKVGEATTKEIAAQTDKVQAGNLSDRLIGSTLSMRKSARNAALWDSLTAWGGISKEAEAPGPGMVKLQPAVAEKVPEHLRDAWFDPRIAGALKIEAQKRLKGGELNAWDAINQFVTGAGFIGPVHHGNMTMHYFQAVGPENYIKNYEQRRMNIEANRQMLDGLDKGEIAPKIAEWANAGANFMSIPQGNAGEAYRNLKGAKALPIGESYEAPESARTSVKPLREANRITTWRTNDALYVDALDAYQEAHPKASKVEVVNEVARHFPDYAGKPLAKMDQIIENTGAKRLANFLTFRGAAQRGAAHQVGDLVGATKWMPEKYYDTEGMTPEMKSDLAVSRFKESIPQNAATLAKGALLYPAISKAAQWITGNPDSKITPKGESHALGNWADAAMAAAPDDERYKLAAWLEEHGMPGLGRKLAAANASPDTGSKGFGERAGLALRKFAIPTPLVSAGLDWDQSKDVASNLIPKMLFPANPVQQAVKGRQTPSEAAAGAVLSVVPGGSDASKFFNRYLHEAISANPDVGMEPDEIELRDDQKRKLAEYRIAAQSQDQEKIQTLQQDLARNAKDPKALRTITKRLKEEDALAQADPADALAYRVQKTAGANWSKIPAGVLNKIYLMASPEGQKAMRDRGYNPKGGQ